MVRAPVMPLSQKGLPAVYSVLGLSGACAHSSEGASARLTTEEIGQMGRFSSSPPGLPTAL